MRNKWTQGPWEVEILPLGSAIVSRQTPDGAPRVIANMALGTDGDTHLLAAAPNLYGALDDILSKWIADADPAECYQSVQAAMDALSKARGEQ